jgi:hypothetical protein
MGTAGTYSMRISKNASADSNEASTQRFGKLHKSTPASAKKKTAKKYNMFKKVIVAVRRCVGIRALVIHGSCKTLRRIQRFNEGTKIYQQATMHARRLAACARKAVGGWCYYQVHSLVHSYLLG